MKFYSLLEEYGESFLMPKGRRSFLDKDLNRVVKCAREQGAPSVDIVSKDRPIYYRINLREDTSDKKPVAYDWESGNKERDIVL